MKLACTLNDAAAIAVQLPGASRRSCDLLQGLNFHEWNLESGTDQTLLRGWRNAARSTCSRVAHRVM